MPVIDDVPATLSLLLGRGDLKLRLLSERHELADDALDRPIRWVHSSDLVDPTPFLADGLVLLITGNQFADDAGADDYDAYVHRLVARGVLALGFGTAVVREDVPEALVTACRSHGLPLFEVPYGTPFIAVARANAEAIAARDYARRSWALAAQRAISLAALRADGLGATLTELSKQLGAWVGLYDAGGTLLREHPVGGCEAARDELRAEVAGVLRRGARAASALTIGSAPYTLQTLGRGGSLRGVLAMASPELDHEGRGVVTSVIAMAGLALEQQERVQRGRASLRAGLLQTLLSGDTALVRRVGREIGAPLPAAPVQVALVRGLGRHMGVLERVDLAAFDAPGSVFAGRIDDDLALIVPEGSELPADVAERFDAHVGVSGAVPHAELSAAVDAARAALAATSSGLVPISAVAGSSVLRDPSPVTVSLAREMLAPLRRHDADNSTELLATLRAFLENDASHEATAQAIGVHRHTVRSRVQAAEKVLGSSLASFPARAEIWAAIVATDVPRT